MEFQLTGVQTAIKKAVLMRANGLAELIDAEVQRAFTPEKIQESIRNQVQLEFERSMTYGEGARAVREIVEKQVAKTIARLASE